MEAARGCRGGAIAAEDDAAGGRGGGTSLAGAADGARSETLGKEDMFGGLERGGK